MSNNLVKINIRYSPESIAPCPPGLISAGDSIAGRMAASPPTPRDRLKALPPEAIREFAEMSFGEGPLPYPRLQWLVCASR